VVTTIQINLEKRKKLEAARKLNPGNLGEKAMYIHG